MAMPDEQFNKCLIVAIRILARRDHSCSELTQKLVARGFSKESVYQVICECQRRNYLDDAHYASSYARRLHNKGYGWRRIEQMLADKGLDRKLIHDSLADYWQERIQVQGCRQALRKKNPKRPGNESFEKARAKIYRFLYQRGFSPAIILRVLGEDFDSMIDP